MPFGHACSHEPKIVVSDEFGGSDSQDFVVDVGSVNDGPLLSIQDQIMDLE